MLGSNDVCCLYYLYYLAFLPSEDNGKARAVVRSWSRNKVLFS